MDQTQSGPTTPERADARAACAAYWAGIRGFGLSEQSTPSVDSAPEYGSPAPGWTRLPANAKSLAGDGTVAGAGPPLVAAHRSSRTVARSDHPPVRFGIGTAPYSPLTTVSTVTDLV